MDELTQDRRVETSGENGEAAGNTGTSEPPDLPTMPLVAQVLELLRAIPAIEFDGEAWYGVVRRWERRPGRFDATGGDSEKQARRRARGRDRSEKAARNPEKQARRRARGRGRSEKAAQDPEEPARQRTSGSSPEPKLDPVLKRCYADLEVPYGADLTAVRAAWKQLVRQHHPDLHATDPEQQQTSTELVKGFNNAYEQLRKRLEKSA